MNTKLFVNLPVKNLKETMDFFSKLGFGFNKQFTNDDAACMVLGEDNYVMLLEQSFFKNFTKKQIANADTSTEAILTLSAESREKVDELADKALAAGGKPTMDPQDHGYMYGRSFQDIDGHMWEVFYMDPSTIQ